MFDVGSRISYKNLKFWFDEIRRLNGEIPIVVCGNKVDLRERVVRPKDIDFHRRHDLQYYDISAKSNYNFEKPFLYILREKFGKDLVFCGRDEAVDMLVEEETRLELKDIEDTRNALKNLTEKYQENVVKI
jgi:GTP-binding nuclear protein Ran